MKKLSFQDAVDILVGCTIMGTGGGGSLTQGVEAVREVMEKGNEIYLADISEVNDESYYINPYFCGSLGPEDGKKENHPELVYAVEALEEYIGEKFEGVVSIEFGGGNTGHAMAAAGSLGKYIVDGDAAGRAVPELQFSTYHIVDIPIYPFSVATKYGDTAIFTCVKNDERAESLSRNMAVASENTVGMADHPIIGKDLKKSIIPGALSLAGRVGKAQREASESGKDPINAIVKSGDGRILFKGKVTKNNTCWEIKEGFTYGTIGISGIKNYESDNFKIWYKNENMMAWKNDEIILTCPDLICVVDLETGYPITNPNCVEGKLVAVLGFSAHEFWKMERGIAILNPRFFGFDCNPVFLEKDE